MRPYLPAILSWLFLLVCRVPASGQTQPAPELPSYRFYGGAAGSLQVFQTVSAEGPIRYLNRIATYPAALMAGYQLTSRLAAELGFTLRRPTSSNHESSGILPDGRSYEAYDRRRAYDYALPLLLRYRLSRPPGRRLHTDALAGLTTLFHQDRQQVYAAVDGQIVDYYLVDERATNHYLTVGLALGYRLAQHLELTAAATAHSNLETLRYAGSRTLTPGLSLGAHYLFGPAR